MKQKLFVVEGTHDEAVLQQCIKGIKTISVGGSQIKEDVLDFLIHNQDNFEIVLLLDPDYPGEKIRKTLASKLKNPKHIFFDRKVSISKNRKKVGIEHVDFKLIREMIQFEVIESNNQSDITTSTLFELGLTGQLNSADLRKKITDYYHIGHCNTKILLQRLSWLGLTTADLERVLNGTSS